MIPTIQQRMIKDRTPQRIGTTQTFTLCFIVPLVSASYLVLFGTEGGGWYLKEGVQGPFRDRQTAMPLAPPEGLDYSVLWSQLGRGPYRRSNTKFGGLVDPEHRVLHRMIAYTLNQRKSSHDKIGDFELWLLHQLVSRDRHTHLAFIIADFLTGARGFRTSSGLLGGHYITRLASSHGILTPEVIASLTCLGDLGRIYQNQLKGMRVIEIGVGSSWVWIGLRVEPEDQEMQEPQQPQHQQQEAGPSGSHQIPSDWDAYTAFQGLSSRTHYHDTQIHRSLGWQNQSLMGFFTNPEFRPSAPPQYDVWHPQDPSPPDLVCRPSNQLYESDFSSSSELQLFLAPKTVFLLPKTDNFLRKTDLQQIRQEEYSGRSRKLNLSHSRREEIVRAARHLLAPRSLIRLDVGSRLGFPTEKTEARCDDYGGDSRECRDKPADTIPGLSYTILLTISWRSEHTQDEYMCIIAHWVDNNWKLQKRIIKFRALTPPFDGVSLPNEIASYLGQ
ncbi:hypothetical protein OSB04_029097 [Centaurea solstitialis]|uniref:Uncharacterized protein n=1 Tax=Centaurea solstitialis TaxID=347529 RepID=A0AA38STX0_9ASTR|nr:hypothetical protein OSB04_029097 [Centaurea solstitialis]